MGRAGARFPALLARSMRAMVDAAAKLPRAPRKRELAKQYPAEGAQRMRVALHAGCVQEVIAPAITASAIRVLTRFGAEVTIVEGLGCCGALNHHLGQT